MISIAKYYLFCVTIAAVYVLPGCKPKPDKVIVADYLVKNHLTVDIDSVMINQLLDTLLERKFQINRPYDPSFVNIYIVDSKSNAFRKEARLEQLANNCAYAGYNIIFLDDAYLRSFLDQHHVIPDPHTDELKDDQECFLYWVIGHELGHMMCGHLRGHFGEGSLDKLVQNSDLDNKAELQADSFFVHAIISSKSLRFSEERLMINILNAEIEQKIGKVETYGVGIMYDYTNEHVVSFAKQPTHPEYVVRLSRMLELSAKMGGDTGMYNMVSSFIKQLKEMQ